MGNEENGNEDWHLPNEYWMLGSGKKGWKRPQGQVAGPRVGLVSRDGISMA